MARFRKMEARDSSAAAGATERVLTCKKCTHARAIFRASVWSSTRPSYVSAGSSYVIELYPVHYRRRTSRMSTGQVLHSQYGRRLTLILRMIRPRPSAFRS